MAYIVIRRPNDYEGKYSPVEYYVVDDAFIARKVNEYINDKITRNPNIYAAIDLFNHIINRKKARSYIDACRYCRYLNKRNYGK